MNTPDYENRLNDIKSRIGKYSQVCKKQSITSTNIMTPRMGFISKIPNIPYNSVLFYIIPPVFTLIILLIWNPKFVTKEVKNKDNVVTRKRNFKILLIISVIVGIIIDISMFAYFNKK